MTSLVVNERNADAFESETRYRLTTRPAPPPDAGALVAAIRSADEAVTTVTVEAGGPLESEFVFGTSARLTDLRTLSAGGSGVEPR